MPFDAVFQHSFVCYDPGYNLLFHSVFGMPPKSKFLRFALERARLNFKSEEFRKQIVFMRYGPTFLSKMFFKFNDKTINIIDSQYLVYNHNNNNTQNYMIQVICCKICSKRIQCSLGCSLYLKNDPNFMDIKSWPSFTIRRWMVVELMAVAIGKRSPR